MVCPLMVLSDDNVPVWMSVGQQNPHFSILRFPSTQCIPHTTEGVTRTIKHLNSRPQVATIPQTMLIRTPKLSECR